jgi:hypothetical protein
LGEVFVSSGNHGSHALGNGLGGQGANDIIGLQAIDHHQWPSQRTHGIKDWRHLQTQVIWHGRSIGLVCRINGISKGGSPGVEDAGYKISRPVLTQSAKHVDHTRDGPGGQAAAAAQIWHGVKGAVDKA